MKDELFAAVCTQLGDGFEDDLLNCNEHGAAGGFNGFIYYADTIAFYQAHRADILELLDDTAQDFGISVLEMIKGFACIDATDKEIATTLWCEGDVDEGVANCLAWFTLEQAARAHSD